MKHLAGHAFPARLNRQRGAAIIWFVSALLGALMVLTTTYRMHAVRLSALNAERDQKVYLDEVMQNALRWYQRNAISIEASGQVVTPAQILAEIAPDNRFGIHAAVSNRLGLPCPADAVFGSCVPYRVIVVWLQPISSSDTTTFDASTGSFVPDPVVVSAGTSRMLNTKLYQQGVLTQVSALLNTVATRLQNRARAQQSVIGEASFENYFRLSDCASELAGFLPCIDTYTDITTTIIPSQLGLSNQDFLTPWGDPVQVSNLLDSSTLNMPFSLALRVSTPWGQSTSMTVRHPQ